MPQTQKNGGQRWLFWTVILLAFFVSMSLVIWAGLEESYSKTIIALVGWASALITLLFLLVVDKEEIENREKAFKGLILSASVITILFVFIKVALPLILDNLIALDPEETQRACQEEAYIDYVKSWNSTCMSMLNEVEVDQSEDSPFYCFLPDAEKERLDLTYKKSLIICK